MMDRTIERLVVGDEWSASAPRVSLVIAWPGSIAELGDALRARLPHHLDAALDTIVVTPLPPESRITDAFPDVRFIPAGDGASVAHMRTLGAQHALGDIVMLVDDVV